MSTLNHSTTPDTNHRFKAILRGKGAVAQAVQRAIALGTRSVYIGGENAGIVNTGFLLTVNNYRAKSASKIDKRELAKHLHAYLESLQGACNESALFSLDRPATQAGATSIDLERIFVPLSIFEANVAEPKPVSCEHLLSLAPGRNLVLLGDAGQGKSITLLHLAYQLAHWLTVKRGWDDVQQLHHKLGLGAFKELAIPIHVPLNVFAEAFKAGLGLKDFLDTYLKRPSLQLPADFFSALLEHDQPAVLLLDGLDEILDQNLREEVAEHLRNLARERHNVRFIVSCRPSAYRGQSQMGASAAHYFIAPFDEALLEKIVRSLYLAICAGDGQDARKTRDLLAEIKRLEEQRKATGEQAHLIDSPLMASLAVRVREYSGQPLPSRRVDFLRQAVEATLNVEYDPKAEERSLLQQAVGGWENHRTLLSLIAFDRLKVGARDLTGPDLESILNEAGVDPAIKDALAKFAQTRGGLLRWQSDGRYRFIHLAIQQWLAAWHLVVQDQKAADLATFFVEDNRIADEQWREVALLIAGLRREWQGNLQGDNRRLAEFLTALAAHAGNMQRSPAVRFACAEVAIRGADDDLASTHPVQLELTQVAAGMLEDDAAMATGSLDARLALGRHLTLHGDPRPHVMTVDAMQFCLVPRGPFWMGDDASDFADERPQHKLEMPDAYWIGRYPITNAQFNQFMQEKDEDGLTGYTNPKWWTIARAAGAWANGQVNLRIYTYIKEWLPDPIRIQVDMLEVQGRYAELGDLIRSKKLDTLKTVTAATPGDIPLFGKWLSFAERVSRYPNHPVAAISWYEALAFCAWLEQRWHKHGCLPSGQHVSLPNEPEWEKAARGGEQIIAQPVLRTPATWAGAPHVTPIPNPNTRRNFPWGNDFSPEACNVEATGVRSTTPVGCFSSSAHPYGCQEMSGNVGEWTRSLYGRYIHDTRSAQLDFAYPYSTRLNEREDATASTDITRVVRGGAFNLNGRGARCAYRDGNRPDDRDDDIGFRVVVSPISLYASGL